MRVEFEQKNPTKFGKGNCGSSFELTEKAKKKLAVISKGYKHKGWKAGHDVSPV